MRVAAGGRTPPPNSRSAAIRSEPLLRNALAAGGAVPRRAGAGRNGCSRPAQPLLLRRGWRGGLENHRRRARLDPNF